MTQATLETLRPGAQTIVVDRGRFGHRSIGVAWCGPMDAPALQRALAAVRERADTAALEIAYGGFECRFTHATRAALAGADCNATLDGKALRSEGAFDAAAGSVLISHAPRDDSRTFLAVRGGFDVPIYLGSRTTDLGAAFGGFNGRALRTGDRVPIGPQAPDTEFTPHGGAPRGGEPATVRVIPTHEHTGFDEESRAAFWAADWTVTHECNRMGYRLDGPALRFSAARAVRPHAVFPGVIQVPPGGGPIVLMSDAQTTGGYPKIGVVVEEDLWIVAQRQTGRHLRFVEATT
ncbi:MAG: biotin-dependent carboxyltransferase family protein [Vulcanimicrobiaceae bacterium]